jgi:hypothetical protein
MVHIEIQFEIHHPCVTAPIEMPAIALNGIPLIICPMRIDPLNLFQFFSIFIFQQSINFSLFNLNINIILYL